MSNTGRDPRVDPRPGDVLEDAPCLQVIEVIRLEGDNVMHQIRATVSVSRAQWSETMKGLRVVARGAERSGP